MRKARKAEEISQERAAELVEEQSGKPVSASTIANWEAGRTIPPRADYVLVICRECGVSPTWVLTGQEPRRWAAHSDGPSTNVMDAVVEEVLRRMYERD